jgi:TetR/AcrR family tetracycline transcriptional repressor
MSSPELPAPRTRRTRGALSRDAIVDAAIEVLDEGGLDALTMRAVAERLGKGAMSLYRHVDGREALLDLVVARLLADAGRGLAPTGEWRHDLAAIARAVREALLVRPDLTVLLTSRSGEGSGALASLDAVLGVLRAAGFGPREAAFANHALGNLVAGAALWEAVGLGGARGAARRARAGDRAAALAELPADRFPNVAWAAEALFAGTADERFEFGLDRLLDGLETRLRVR